MTKIIVLCGGDSDERAVSLRSGAAVAAALESAGYEVSILDPAQPAEDYEQQLVNAGVAFPVLHGKNGEDGAVQVWLEARSIRYVGADAAVSALCFDKWRYKQALRGTDVRLPRGEVVTEAEFESAEIARAPFVLKPYDGGSSVDTYIVRDPATADLAAIKASFTRHPQMLLEELVSGTEITVGVLIDQALPVIEIVPPPDGEFDYENKYNGRTLELCPPQSVSESLQHQAQALALSIHQQLGIRDMSRTDMIIDASGQLYVLETNTIPGMTDQSLFPKAAAVAGLTMPELCSKLVTSALEREARWKG